MEKVSQELFLGAHTIPRYQDISGCSTGFVKRYPEKFLKLTVKNLRLVNLAPRKLQHNFLLLPAPQAKCSPS